LSLSRAALLALLVALASCEDDVVELVADAPVEVQRFDAPPPVDAP
jgi:hypothetical protein